jgi:hypothetical protein
MNPSSGIFLLLMLGWSGVLRAQSDFISLPKYLDTPIAHRLILTWAPLGVIDAYDGTSLRPGIKWKIYHHLYLRCEGGWYIHMPFNVDDQVKGHFLKPAIQWNFTPELLGKTWSTTYLSLEVMWKYKRYQFADSINLITRPMYLTEVPMTRHVYVANVVIGQEMREHWGLHWEWFAGLGFRYTYSQTTLVPLQYKYIVYDNDYPNTDNDDIGMIGRIYFLNVTAGIRIDLGLF